MENNFRRFQMTKSNIAQKILRNTCDWHFQEVKAKELPPMNVIFILSVELRLHNFD